MCLAVPLKLIEVLPEGKEGKVELAGGQTMTVGLELAPEARVGDYLLVHAGMAIEVLAQEEAEETRDLFKEYALVPGLLEPGQAKHD